MPNKLSKFAAFGNAVFPHEAAHLIGLSGFQDKEKQSILLRIAENSNKTDEYVLYDPAIDKRKYSYVKTWSQHQLDAIDVDKIYQQLTEWDYQVATDAITPEGEKALLRLFKHADTSFFSFMRLFDLGRLYRHYLQIRFRKRDFQIVNNFLEKHRTGYEYARLVNDKLHAATEDIIHQYFERSGDTTAWQKWLDSVFHDESLDGYNRILAWIRLIFIGHNYRKFDSLKSHFDYFETMVQSGKFYSRRILANFYSQYLLYYAAMKDFDKASYYGYLSVKEKNNDYLYYVNNLSAILIRKRAFEKALEILRSASETAVISQNFHNKIGHAAYLILAYTDMGKLRQAENHADVFFNAYKHEIFEYRWHLFFSAYLKVLLFRGNYRKILRLSGTYQLAVKDELYRKSPGYSPTIPWICAIAAYREGKILFQDLAYKLSELLKVLHHREGPNMRTDIINLRDIAAFCIPGEWEALKKDNQLEFLSA